MPKYEYVGIMPKTLNAKQLIEKLNELGSAGYRVITSDAQVNVKEKVTEQILILEKQTQ